LFGGSPGISFGMYNIGTKEGVTDDNVLYLMVQESIPGIGGYIAGGFYRGLSDTLFINSDGDEVKTGSADRLSLARHPDRRSDCRASGAAVGAKSCARKSREAFCSR
jgi:hypothetical protein